MERKIPKYEFKPDPTGSSLLKRLYITPRQRKALIKWTLYALVVMAALAIQDTLMARVRLFGATTDLAVCAVIVIGMLEGAEKGGAFALAAGIFYYLSGSAPGFYVVALLTTVTIATALFRQSFWTLGLSTTVLCTGLGMVVYELTLMIIGLCMGLTHWNRLGVFFMTAVFSAVMVFALYPVVRAIGKIGGEAWKE